MSTVIETEFAHPEFTTQVFNVLKLHWLFVSAREDACMVVYSKSDFEKMLINKADLKTFQQYVCKGSKFIKFEQKARGLDKVIPLDLLPKSLEDGGDGPHGPSWKFDPSWVRPIAFKAKDRHKVEAQKDVYSHLPRTWSEATKNLLVNEEAYVNPQSKTLQEYCSQNGRNLTVKYFAEGYMEVIET